MSQITTAVRLAAHRTLREETVQVARPRRSRVRRLMETTMASRWVGWTERRLRRVRNAGCAVRMGVTRSGLWRFRLERISKAVEAFLECTAEYFRPLAGSRAEPCGRPFSCAVIGFFLERRLTNERLANNMLDWSHSGFSVDLTVKIAATSSEARVSLAQYIARPPLSLKKMLVEERGGSVLYRSVDNPYFKTDRKLFPAIGLLVDLLQHLPDSRTHLIGPFGLYSSRSRGTWSRKPYLVRLAPEGWKEQHPLQSASHLGQPHEQEPHLSVFQKETRSAWPRWSRSDHPSPRSAKRTAGARLIAKV